MSWLLLALGLLGASALAVAARRRSPPVADEHPAPSEVDVHARRELTGLREQLAEGELAPQEYALLRDRLAAQLVAPTAAAPARPAPRSGLWLAGLAAATVVAVVLVVPALRERMPGMTSSGNDFSQPAAAAPERLTAKQFGAILRRGRQLDRAGRLAEALPIYRMAVQVLPERADYRAQLGFALARSGRTAAALAELRRAVRLAPSLPFARLYLAAVASRAGRRTEAVAQARRYLELQPTGAGAKVARQILRQR